jgi:glycosyltransferase involved in cell wall biosynthesis
MTISIVTVVLNDVDHIEKTILSVIHQPNIDLEYIIIDGGSTDGTVEIIRRYEKHLSYWLSEPDEGVSDAFNKGIIHADGDIIGLVNSGDFLESGALCQVINVFDENNLDIVYGNVQYWNGAVREYIYKADHTLLGKFMSINHPAVFVKNEIYKKYGMFDRHYRVAMDYELMLRFYIKGARFAYLDTVLSNMALGGLSDVNWNRAYREAYTIRKHYLGKSIKLYLGYLFQILKRYISNFLERLELGYIKQWYRHSFSPINKVKS